MATVIELTVDGTASTLPVRRGLPQRLAGLRQEGDRGECLSKDELAIRSANGAGRRSADTLGDRQRHKPAWLEVDLGQPREVVRVSIDEPAEYRRIQEFQLQYLDGESWKTFYRKDRGAGLVDRGCTGDRSAVRLNILQATDGPTIWEFQLGGAAE